MGEMLKEFFVKIGLDNSQLKGGISDSKSALEGFGKHFAGIIATYFTVNAMKDAITGFNALNTEIDKTSTLLGANAQDVAGAVNAFGMLGVESAEVASSLGALGNAFHEAKFGGGALIEVSKKYGLSLGSIRGGMKNAGAVLERLTSQIGKYSAQTQKAILSQLGFGENMQYAFMSAGDSLKQLLKEQMEQDKNVARDLELSKKFKMAMARVNNEFLKLKNAFARFVIPLLTVLAEKFLKFIDFLKRHKLVIASFFAGLAIVMMPTLIMLGKIAIASAIAFAPIIAIVGVLSAIALIFEDICAYFMGWDSVTGDLVKKFPVIGEILESIKLAVLAIVDIFKAIGDFLENPSWDTFVNIFKTAFDAIIKIFESTREFIKSLVIHALQGVASLLSSLGDMIVSAFKSAFEYVYSLINDYIIEPLKNISDSVISAFKSAFSYVYGVIDNNLIEPLKSVGSVIKSVFVTAFEYVSKIFQAYIVEPINKVKNSINNAFKSVFDYVYSLIQSNLIEPLSGVADSIVSGFKSAFSYIKNLIQSNILEPFKNLGNGVSDKISNAFKSAFKIVFNLKKNNIIEPINKIGNLIKNVFSSAFGYVKSLIKSNISEPLSKVGDAIGNSITGLFKASLNFIYGLIQNNVIEPFKMVLGIAENIKNAMIQAFKEVSDFVMNIFTKITDFISSAFNSAGSAIKEVFTAVFGSIYDAISKIGDIAKTILQNIGDLAKGVFASIGENVVNTFKTISESIVSAFKSAFEYVYKLIQNYVIEPFNKIFKMLGDIGSSVKNVGETISEGASKAWNSAKSFLGFGDDNEKTQEKTQNTVNSRNNLIAQSQAVQAITQPQPPVISGATTNNSSRYDNRVQNITVEVSGANLTDAGARDFGAGLAESINTKSQQNGDIGAF